MKFKFKVIVLGGLVLYAARWVLSLLSGWVIGKLSPEAQYTS